MSHEFDRHATSVVGHDQHNFIAFLKSLDAYLALLLKCLDGIYDQVPDDPFELLDITHQWGY